ncbi:unnamed protein product [Rotaria socialis]|uniref:NmrA-like domain-containing protein n=1 Tax=Rotaria socialis TaxID=392032 RepID=A0A817WZD4_9BILA|nr:unnamed protein product [Rotaria socialis]CAF3299441.1 unnamed protein product [Rotaria socialis]CAF3362594.1 unnamed protein product [Rotaria socialis]CAF3430948.1 unnamed protein product [Rotaria socialis]CAF3518985.1 unnamed protein product [Rotaria socialis]
MSSNKEQIFIVGVSGAIGNGIVRNLGKQNIDTTAYVRDESKAKTLFKDEIDTGHLRVVVGTYVSVDVYTKAIEGHTRIFLLVVSDFKKPTLMSKIKETFAGKQGIIGYVHTTSEEKLWKLADEQPDERSLVVLCPGVFMSNQLMADLQSVKHLNRLVSSGSPPSTFAWIDTTDISDCSVVILTEPIEKHDRCVYEMGAELVTQEQRAAIFSKVLGKSITYEQQQAETLYKMFISFGMSHSYAYDLVSFPIEPINGHVTPQMSILINRPLRTLKEWLQENAEAFQ